MIIFWEWDGTSDACAPVWDIYPEMALVSDACVPVWDTLICYRADTHNTGLAPDHVQAAAFAFVSFRVG